MTVQYNDINEKIEQLKSYCQDSGKRITLQRLEIYRQVAQSCEHPDAETIYEKVKAKIPNISFDTVYRTLNSLEEMGMIFRVDNQLPKARFDADKRSHHHFLCTKCGAVFDIFPEDGYKLNIPKNSSEYGEIKDINLQVRGICKKCKH